MNCILFYYIRTHAHALIFGKANLNNIQCKMPAENNEIMKCFSCEMQVSVAVAGPIIALLVLS